MPAAFTLQLVEDYRATAWAQPTAFKVQLVVCHVLTP